MSGLGREPPAGRIRPGSEDGSVVSVALDGASAVEGEEATKILGPTVRLVALSVPVGRMVWGGTEVGVSTPVGAEVAGAVATKLVWPESEAVGETGAAVEPDGTAEPVGCSDGTATLVSPEFGTEDGTGLSVSEREPTIDDTSVGRGCSDGAGTDKPVVTDPMTVWPWSTIDETSDEASVGMGIGTITAVSVFDAADEITDSADDTTAPASEVTTEAADSTADEAPATTDEATLAASEVTPETTEATGSATDDTTEAADEATDPTSEVTTEAMGSTTEETTDAPDSTTDDTTDAPDSTTEGTAEVIEATTDGTTEATDSTTEGATEATDSTTDAALETTDSTADGATEATDSITGVATEATDSTTDGTMGTTEPTKDVPTVAPLVTALGSDAGALEPTLGIVSGMPTGDEAGTVVGAPVTGTPTVAPDESTVTVIGTTTTALSELEAITVSAGVSCREVSTFDVN